MFNVVSCKKNPSAVKPLVKLTSFLLLFVFPIITLAQSPLNFELSQSFGGESGYFADAEAIKNEDGVITHMIAGSKTIIENSLLDGVFKEKAPLPDLGDDFVGQVALLDLDGDGVKSDIVSSLDGIGQYSLRVWRNTGFGKWQAGLRFVDLPGRAVDIVPFEFPGNKVGAAVVSEISYNPETTKLTIYEINPSTLALSPVKKLWVPGLETIQAHDWLQKETSQIAGALTPSAQYCTFSHTCSYLIALSFDSDLNFEYFLHEYNDVEFDSSALADFTNDGVPDLFFSSKEKQGRIFKMTAGNKIAQFHFQRAAGNVTGIPEVFDLNGDGLNDIINPSDYRSGSIKKDQFVNLYYQNTNFDFVQDRVLVCKEAPESSSYCVSVVWGARKTMCGRASQSNSRLIACLTQNIEVYPEIKSVLVVLAEQP